MLSDTYLKNSNIPKRYLIDTKLIPAKVDLQTFKELKSIKENIIDFVDEGKNLLICSTSAGNGKTTWATKIMKEYISKVDCKMFKHQTPALYINITNFLNEKKLAINDLELSAKVRDLETKILSSKLVIFDDLCVKDLSTYDMGQLYYWIDYRTSNMLSTIYTTNLLPKQLSKVLDARLYSRIVNYSEIKEFKDGDNRGTKV